MSEAEYHQMMLEKEQRESEVVEYLRKLLIHAPFDENIGLVGASVYNEFVFMPLTGGRFQITVTEL